MHHLESGDMVTFKEVKGMTCINTMTCRVEGGYNVSLATEYHVGCVSGGRVRCGGTGDGADCG